MLVPSRHLCVLVLLLAVGCDSAREPVDQGSPLPSAGTPLVPARDYAPMGGPTAWFSNGTNPFLTWDGRLIDFVGSGPFESAAAGIWLGGLQTGGVRSSVVLDETGLTSFCEDALHLFTLHADSTYSNTDSWPRSLGAPTHADGRPLVYGDEMLWGSFCPRAREFGGAFGNLHATPLRDIRVNTSVYRYERPALEGVRFVRYDVTNTGGEPIYDLRVGFYSDTDLSGGRPSPDQRYTIDVTDFNAVGYDAPSGLSYVYGFPVEHVREGSSVASTFFWDSVVGFAFLDGPPLLAHRIFPKPSPEGFDSFAEAPRSSTEAVRVLDGLSVNGAPMVDPTTREETAFALSGDPFGGGTGWIDGLDENGEYVGADVQQLLSAGPTSLGPNETVSLTVVWIESADLVRVPASYADLQRTLAAVRAEPSLWRFDGDG